MPEPTSSSGAGGAVLVAIGASLVGHRYGALATVAAVALIGAFISLGEVSTRGGRRGALAYLLQYTLTACVCAGALSYLIDRYTGVPAVEILALVAFGIGWIGGRWRGLLDAAVAAAVRLVGRQAPPAGGGGKGGKR